GSVVIHIVTIGDLSRAAMAAAVVSNDTIALGEEEQHLAVPIVRGKRPTMVEDNWLGILWTPVLIKDVNAVFGGNDSHLLNPFSWVVEPDGAPNNRMERLPGVVRQICARPPSTASSLAVMKLLSDDARKAAAAPISAGSAMRWSGFIDAKTFMPSSPTAAFASSVAVGPGDSTFTRMPVPFRSSAQLRAKLRTAALLAL